jgi:hypothetical protein
LEFFHGTWERIIPSIFTDEDGVIFRIEVFSRDSEFFVSILEMDEESNFVIMMRIGSIYEEPFISIIIIWDVILDVLLDRLSLDIIRISGTD